MLLLFRADLPRHGVMFICNDCKVFQFCKSKCHKNFKKKRTHGRSGGLKSSGKQLAGKELTVDNSFEFEKPRNEPVKYQRELWSETIDTMKRVEEIKQKRQAKFIMNSLTEFADTQKSKSEEFFVSFLQSHNLLMFYPNAHDSRRACAFILIRQMPTRILYVLQMPTRILYVLQMPTRILYVLQMPTRVLYVLQMPTRVLYVLQMPTRILYVLQMPTRVLYVLQMPTRVLYVLQMPTRVLCVLQMPTRVLCVLQMPTRVLCVLQMPTRVLCVLQMPTRVLCVSPMAVKSRESKTEVGYGMCFC
ncbi:hypothetical protein STEG23_032390 [Scotinomys teguina]